MNPSGNAALDAAPDRARAPDAGASPGILFLHYVALSSLAVAKPLLDVLQKDATFFVARRSDATELALFALALFAVVPLALFGATWIAARIHPRAGRAATYACVASFAALFLLVPGKRVLGEGSIAAGALAIAGGIGFAALYARARAVRSFVTVLALAPLLFAGLFFADPAIRKVASGSSPAAAARAPVASNKTLVMVVFDELPLTSLLRYRFFGEPEDAPNSERIEVEENLFPNFSKLSRDSVWFRNATASHESTEQALPAILTGVEPSDQSLLPTLADHPDNAFTLLAPSHRMKIWETFTDLCPPEFASDARTELGARERILSLVHDASVVYGHVVLPVPWARALPPITEQWGGFGQTGVAAEAPVENGVDRLAVKDTRARSDRAEAVEAFIESIDGSKEPTFYFLHVMLPHGPWMYLPSGKSYDPGGPSPGYHDGRWSEDEAVTALGYQRHLLQLGAVDRLLGRLIERLKTKDVYDDAVVCVLADHGVSFGAGEFGRRVFAKNAQEIARIPLFVKPSKLREARVVDANVETVDVLPTIADAMGFALPWTTAGRSALASDFAPRATKVVHRKNGKPMTLDAAFPEQLAQFPQLALTVGLFGSEPSWDDILRMDRTVRYAIQESTPFASGLKARVEHEERFASVDLRSPEVPCFLKGRITARDARVPELISVALNGMVCAEAQTYERDSRQCKFAVMLPEWALREGQNELTVLAWVTPQGAWQVIARDGEGDGAPR